MAYIKKKKDKKMKKKRKNKHSLQFSLTLKRPKYANKEIKY